MYRILPELSGNISQGNRAMQSHETVFKESSEGRRYVENSEHPAAFSKIILDLCKARLKENKGLKNRYRRENNV